MNITIRYKLHPDKDFCLNNPEKFNGEFVDEIDSYVGKVSFDGAEPSIEAKDFLERLLCDGIHVKPSCYYLLKRFCNIIDNLEDFISSRSSFILTEPEIFEYSQSIGGNYEGTEFKVTISRDEKTAKKIIASNMVSEKGFMVFDDAGTSVSDYGAAEKWFPTYEEAAQYALDLVKNRTFHSVYESCLCRVMVYEGEECLLHKSHSVPCGKVVFDWQNYQFDDVD